MMDALAVGLAGVVNGRVEGGELRRCRLLQLVDEHEHAYPEVTGGLTEDSEEGGKVRRQAAGVGDPVDRLDVDAETHRPRRVDFEAEGLEDAEEAPQAGLRMASRGRSQGRQEGAIQRHRERGGRPSLDLGGDPSPATHVVQKLGEEHGLPDPAQAVEDPASVAFPHPLGALLHHGEGVEERTAASEEGRSSPRTGSKRVDHRVHV